MAIIERGCEFPSYEDFIKAIADLEEQTFATFYIKNSDKVKKANAKRRHKAPEEFVITRAQYVCSHFGEARQRANAEKKRNNTKSTKLGCDASFVVCYDDRRNVLVIAHCNLQHNHPTTFETYIQERKKKALSDEEKKFLKDYLYINPDTSNASLLRLINTRFNKALALKDIRSLKHTLKDRKNSTASSTQENAPSGERISISEEVKKHMTDILLSRLSHAITSCETTTEFQGRFALISTVLDSWDLGERVILSDGVEGNHVAADCSARTSGVQEGISDRDIKNVSLHEGGGNVNRSEGSDWVCENIANSNVITVSIKDIFPNQHLQKRKRGPPKQIKTESPKKSKKMADSEKLEDFLLQYPSCDEDAAGRAFLVYQDLTDVRGWWYTELAYSSQFDRPYVIGQRSRFVPREAVLPMNVEDRVSLKEIQHLFSQLLVDEEPIKCITMAVNEEDSTTVYYKLTSGLSPPDDPDVVAERRREKDQRMDRKRRHVAACVRQATQRFSDGV